MIFDTSIIQQYEDIAKTVYKLFAEKKLEHKPFYTKIGVDRHVFSRRIKSQSFTPGELIQICEQINESFQTLSKHEENSISK